MGKRFIEIIKDVIKELLDIIYPPDNKCISCLEGDYIGLCDNCLSKINRVRNDGDIFSYGYYGGPLKKVILSFKYNRNFLAGRILAEFLYELIQENNISLDLIMYVPMSKKSIKKRGFNQCEIIAKILSKKLNVPISHDLIKVRETREQKTLTREDRAKNISGAFIVGEKNKLRNKNVILIDDVITTGATMLECKRTLKKHGISSIKLLTVAKSDI